MNSVVIREIRTRDVRFDLKAGEGTDSVHSNPQYSYAVTELRTDDDALYGTGLAFTLGGGNDLVCRAAELLAETLVGREIEDLMANYGSLYNALANHPQLRWLGPHKGVVHLALASITNACWDLWAKSWGVPLWKLLLDLSPEAIAQTLDFSYLEDVLTRDEFIDLVTWESENRDQREDVLREGYPGYDTSVGWMGFSDDEIRRRTEAALVEGFGALKLKVGSADPDQDVRRAHFLRDLIGDDRRLMLDVNQQWSLPQALEMCHRLAPVEPFWIEEPTHPDDVTAHQRLALEIAPMKVALGEHVPHAVLFKNFVLSNAMGFCQVDAVRVGGVSEFLVVSAMARRYGIPVVPHVGDMGQIHQHLVLFNHIALGHERLFLEYIPHLREHFVHPADVREGVYHTPQEPG
ncbi:MAG: mandelate racemase, partial [Candidatus Poribacteria bacterium]|nr:mandelate racemase [Candidatus Poribacteria bacterium]